jgi:hypothetical protein
VSAQPDTAKRGWDAWRRRIVARIPARVWRRDSWRSWWRKIALAGLALVVLAWALAPALRGVTLVATIPRGAGPSDAEAHAAGLTVQDVAFRAGDGTRLTGWFISASPQAATVILVHGFKADRTQMLPYARFLWAAGYNVLLYDSRGCTDSDGWRITLGAHEPDDVLAAVKYLSGRADLTAKRFGGLGISLGAGIVLLAGAREPQLAAVVADSAWADEHAQLDRMGSIPIGRLAVPVLPYEPALVNALVGADLRHVSPLAAISSIAPRAVLLIHSADDENTTTPLSGERAMYAAAGQPKQEWIAPSGGHIGGLSAHPTEYQQRVLAFFAAYLGQPARAISA